MPNHPATVSGASRLTTVARRAGSVAAVAALALGVPLAQVSSAGTLPAAHAGKGAVVVKAATRPKVGKILVTATGATLYRDTDDKPNKPSCTGTCAAIWPPLVMPAGKTKPEGADGVTGLGTVKISGGKLQVTFHKEPLYTFSGDSGTSTNGNGIGPFEVVPAP